MESEDGLYYVYCGASILDTGTIIYEYDACYVNVRDIETGFRLVKPLNNNEEN